MTANTTEKLTHVWQEAGLGQAPFRCTGHMDTGSVTTTCDYCGAGLRYVFFVQDANGHSFKVGMDCIDRTGDVRVTTAAKQAKAQADRERRQAEYEERRKEQMLAWQAELDRQRAINGGETDQERSLRIEKQKQDELVERVNGWLIAQFKLRNPNHGGWDGLNDLLRTPITQKSERYISIVRDTWCKTTGGRRGSKAYTEAESKFWDHMEAVGYQFS